MMSATDSEHQSPKQTPLHGQGRSPVPMRLFEPDLVELASENPEGLVIIDEAKLAQNLGQLLHLVPALPHETQGGPRRLFLETESIGRQRLLDTLSTRGARFAARTLAALRRLERLGEDSSSLMEAHESLLGALSDGLISRPEGVECLIRTCRQARQVIDAKLAPPSAPLPIVVSLTHQSVDMKKHEPGDSCSAQSLPRRGLSEREMECMLSYCQPLSRDSGLLLAGLHVNLDALDLRNPENLHDAAERTLRVWRKLPSPWGVSTSPRLIVESAQKPEALMHPLTTFFAGLAEAREALCLLWKGDLLDDAVFELFSPSPGMPPEVVKARWNPLCTQGLAEYLLDQAGDRHLIRRGFDPLFSLTYEP